LNLVGNLERSLDQFTEQHEFTHGIQPRHRLRPKVRIFLGTDFVPGPLLQESFPMYLLLTATVRVQDNAHPKRTWDNKFMINFQIRIILRMKKFES
jgi:hypothetical protein